jgi:uncharacterized protein YbaA (DUF1428 family)
MRRIISACGSEPDLCLQIRSPWFEAERRRTGAIQLSLTQRRFSMSHYIDAIVIPVPRANLDTYKRLSAEWGNAHLRHGAMYYSDSISDDAQPGKLTSFPQAVQLKDGEVIALAWVVYRNKEDRDRISKAVMEDPQLKESMDPSKMPFDGKRMFWGGFETITELAGGR